MFLLEWTASDLLLIVVAAAAMIGTVIWLVPSTKDKRPAHAYTQAEITAYDRRIPLYFLAAALALVLGGLHMVIKNIPGFWQWLWEAGYGGHLFRDLANSHIIIVGGGTILLTAITWYVLPRIVNRPLYSNTLAAGSFWFTFIGVVGFYLAWLVLGLVEGNLVRGGMNYMDAKALVGSWHTVPTRITSMIMGVGYWTYVLNVFLTVWVSRRVTSKPLDYLTKFIAVSAAALFAGTVQGVLQVLPANADWIHNAGKFGEYVDPISHAHINLVTGMVVSLAAFIGYFSFRLGGREISRRKMNVLFWLLVPGSLIFYFTFLLTGLILGGAIEVPAAIHTFLAQNFTILIAFSGVAMLSGFWAYFSILGFSLRFRTLKQQFFEATPTAFWLVSLIALFVGTFQGLLQAIPATSRILTIPEEIPNIHAQLNMIGGVLLALIGLVYYLLPELTKQKAASNLKQLSLFGISFGIAGYYTITLLSGLRRLHFMEQGMTSIQAAAQLSWVAPLSLFIIALPILVGFCAFALAVYRATEFFRSEFAADLRLIPARFSGPMPSNLNGIKPIYMIAIEAVGALFGWPGVGWLFSGQTMIGIALLLIGPAIAWAVLPMLFSPFTNTMLSQWNWLTLVVWLPGSALISSSLLAFRLWRKRHPATKAATQAATTSTSQPERATAPPQRISRRVAIGAAIIFVFLFSVPVLPFFMGIVDGTPQYTLIPALHDRSSGAYLDVSDTEQQGLMKLFVWNFPLDEVPANLPVLNPTFVHNIVISQRGLDDVERYQLYHIHGETNHRIELAALQDAGGRQLVLTPTETLESGDYMLTIPVDGMFAGREYYYFRLDPFVAALPVISPEQPVASTTPQQPASTVWLEVFPLTSAMISLLLVWVMVGRLRTKVRPHEAAWAVAFAMFALAAGAQVVGDIAGWTATLARIYYVLGATLVVGWLGLGTWLLLVHQPWLRNVGLWSILLLTGMGFGLISLTPVDATALAQQGWQALEKPIALTIVTIATNTIGTVLLVGGALWSAWVFWRKRMMKQRMYGLILIAVGAMAVAAGGSLTRLGHQQYLYIAMSIGIGLMLWGYLKTIRPAAVYAPQNPPSAVSSDLATDSV